MIVFYLMELALHNAHVIYNENNKDDQLSLCNFQIEVAKALCSNVDDNDSRSSNLDFDEGSLNDAPPRRCPTKDVITPLCDGDCHNIFQCVKKYF